MIIRRDIVEKIKQVSEMIFGYARKFHYAFAIGFFFILTSYMTYPFIIHPFTTLVASPAGDISNSASLFEAIKREGKNPFVDDQLETINSPEGISSNPAVNRVSLFSTLFLWVNTIIFNSLFSHGLLVFSGYLLSMIVMYAFIFRLTKQRKIALLAGIITGTFPLFLALARAASTYTHMWMYILPIWAFYELWLRQNRRNYVLAALSVIPAMFWTPYFTQHIMIIGFTLIAIMLFTRRDNWKQSLSQLYPLLGIATFWVFLCGLYILLGISTERGGAPTRTIQEAYEQSADLLMYVVPGVFSTWGQGLYQSLVQTIPKAEGTTLYLGVSTLSLAALGLWSTFKKRQFHIPAVMTVALIVVLVLFSLPPTFPLAGLDIPTPNYIVASLVPALRAGQRLAAPIMICVIILATLGISYLLKTLPYRYRNLAFVGIALLCLVDLSSKPPQMTHHIQSVALMRTLSNQPKGITAQYSQSSVGDPHQIACQLQIFHNQPILNDCGIKPSNNPHYNSKALISVGQAPKLCDQVAILKSQSVKYVILSTKEWDKVVSCYQNYNIIARDSNFIIYDLRN